MARDGGFCCCVCAAAGVSVHPFGVLLLGSFSSWFGPIILVDECQIVGLFVLYWSVAGGTMVLLLLLSLFVWVWSVANNEGIHEISR